MTGSSQQSDIGAAVNRFILTANQILADFIHGDAPNSRPASSEGLRNLIMEELAQLLDNAMRDRLKLPWLNLPYRSWWMTATAADFEAATKAAASNLAIRNHHAVIAEAKWKFGHIRLREHGLWLEGSRHAILLGTIGNPMLRYSSSTGGSTTSIDLSLIREIDTLLGNTRHTGKMKSASAKSLDGAIASMKRLVATFFGVSMENTGAETGRITKRRVRKTRPEQEDPQKTARKTAE